MKSVLHPANQRGHADHGWLDTHHTFSFASYYNPERVRFGKLRVLNDDIVQPGMGFGTHPHDNMEIISIPLKGALAHKDSMGHVRTIEENEVQVMSAGTGLTHSEFNGSDTEAVNFLQIWIFPEHANVEPRYEQTMFDPAKYHNQLFEIVGPKGKAQNLWINQQAWMYRSRLDTGKSVSHSPHSSDHGVYVFVIEGEVQIGDQQLEKRDGLGLYAMESVTVEAISDAEVLLIEVPMD